MTIQLEETGSKGRYWLRTEDGHLSELTFSRAGEKLIIIDHTDVPAALKGRGIGVMLVERAVEDARSAGSKIVPLCPFAAAQFRKHPQWSDVLNA